jgi:hypothetical protein
LPHVPKWGQTRQQCTLISAVILQAIVFFSLLTVVSYFCAFFCLIWWFYCLKWSLTIALNYCVVFLSARRLQCALEKTCFLDKLPLDMCAFSINDQQYTLHKTSLNGNTRKMKLYIDQLLKIFWPKAHKNLTLYFLRRDGSLFTKGFQRLNCNLTTKNSKNWFCIVCLQSTAKFLK